MDVETREEVVLQHEDMIFSAMVTLKQVGKWEFPAQMF